MGRGRLTFKGEKNPPKKKMLTTIKHKTSPSLSTAAIDDHEEHDNDQHEVTAADDRTIMENDIVITTEAISSASDDNITAATTSKQQIHIHKGKGQITSSGTVITGHNTKFSIELNVGDAIIIYNQQKQEIMRIITMRLSDTSCAISSPFPNDCKCYTDFFYIQKPRLTNNADEERKKLDEKAKQKEEDEKTAFGTYSRSDKLVYHEKSSTGTSYIIKTEDLGREVTRGELLNMRSKKKSDKYCH